MPDFTVNTNHNYVNVYDYDYTDTNTGTTYKYSWDSTIDGWEKHKSQWSGNSGGTYTAPLYQPSTTNPILVPSTGALDKETILRLLKEDSDFLYSFYSRIKSILINDYLFREHIQDVVESSLQCDYRVEGVLKEFLKKNITAELTREVNGRTMLNTLVTLKEQGSCDELFKEFLTPIHRAKSSDELSRSVKV